MVVNLCVLLVTVEHTFDVNSLCCIVEFDITKHKHIFAARPGEFLDSTELVKQIPECLIGVVFEEDWRVIGTNPYCHGLKRFAWRQ